MDFTPRQPRPRNYGWNLYEGSQRFEEALRPRELVFPVKATAGVQHPGGRVSRVGADVRRGRYIYGDYCSGTIWSFKMAEGAATDAQVEPFRVESLSSFGQNTAGELFAVSQNGTIYRVT